MGMGMVRGSGNRGRDGGNGAVVVGVVMLVLLVVMGLCW